MLLLVTFGWTSNQFERQLERKLHFLIATSTVLVSSIPLFFGGYNPRCGTCDVAPMPLGCDDHTTECVRGDPITNNIFIYIFRGALSIATLFCTGAMISIYRTVYRQEKKMAAYRFRGAQEQTNEEINYPESKRIRKTMLFYTSSFYICWIIPMIIWLTPHSVPYLEIIADILFSLMGFFNMLVFIQPKCLRYQKDHPGTNILTCYFFVVFHSQIISWKRFLSTSTWMDNSDSDGIDDDLGFKTYNVHNSILETFDSQNKPSGPCVLAVPPSGEADGPL